MRNLSRLLVTLACLPTISLAAVVQDSEVLTGPIAGATTQQTAPAAFSNFGQPNPSSDAPVQTPVTAPISGSTASQSTATPTAVNLPQPAAPVAADPSALPSKSDIAFRSLLESALPLSPDQITQLRRLYDLTQQAAATPPSAPPTPISSSLVVSLDPGNQPPIVRLSAGFVSSLVFVDSTGAPWPITAFGLGDPGSFNIQWDELSNTLFVQSLKPYAHGNLAVRLNDLNTPVMISLVSGQKEVDYRVDLQVTGRGPKATAPIMPSSLNHAEINPVLINVLDGIAPEGSRKLNISPEFGQAWLTNKNRIYFRTSLTVLSPAWTATVSSANGTRVYEMPKTPMILASQDGKTITVEIKGL